MKDLWIVVAIVAASGYIGYLIVCLLAMLQLTLVG